MPASMHRRKLNRAIRRFATPLGIEGLEHRLMFSGMAGQMPEIELASAGDSRDPATELGNDHSSRPAISADGRYVAFVSDADNLTPGDTNGARDVFVKDMRTGDLALVSTAADGTQGNARAFSAPSLSGDGRYVAFTSQASNLVAHDGNGNTSDVFVKDLRTGRVKLASASRNGAQIPGGARFPAITPDGRFVAFAGDGAYVKDLQTGELTLVAGGFYDTLSISDDGRFVAYSSFSSVQVKDLQTGMVTLASSAQDGTAGNSSAFFGQISGNGRYVSFGSYSDNLVPNDGNGSFADIFVKDLVTGEIRLVSDAEDGTPGNDAAFFSTLSRDGTWIAFSSDASNLVPGDANGFGTDFFVRNLLTGELTLLTHDTASTLSINLPGLSANGRYVTFDARNGLVPGDFNGAYDVFYVDLHNGPAGNVRSQFIHDPQQGTILVLTGDAADNDIVVRSPAPGIILVEGRFGTTIDGSPAVTFLIGIESIRIELGSGDDSVFADDLRIDGSLNFDLGDGNDTLDVHRGSVGALTLDAGAGSDATTLDLATILGETSIRMGEGDDVLAIIDSFFADDSLADGGRGDDVLAMYGSNSFSRKQRHIRFEVV